MLHPSRAVHAGDGPPAVERGRRMVAPARPARYAVSTSWMSPACGWRSPGNGASPQPCPWAYPGRPPGPGSGRPACRTRKSKSQRRRPSPLPPRGLAGLVDCVGGGVPVRWGPAPAPVVLPPPFSRRHSGPPHRRWRPRVHVLGGPNSPFRYIFKRADEGS